MSCEANDTQGNSIYFGHRETALVAKRRYMK